MPSSTSGALADVVLIRQAPLAILGGYQCHAIISESGMSDNRAKVSGLFILSLYSYYTGKNWKCGNFFTPILPIFSLFLLY